MKMFQTTPKEIFPFPVTGCDSFTDGAVCSLKAGPKIANGEGTVRVSTSATSFTFEVISDDYFDARGSTISFSLTDEDGELYLNQKADAQKAYPVPWLGVKAGYTDVVWGNQAHNLRSALGVHPSDPINWSSPTDWVDLIGGNWDRFR